MQLRGAGEREGDGAARRRPRVVRRPAADQILADLPDPVCRWRPDTTLTFVNAAYAHLHGRDPAALVGRRLVDLFGGPPAAETIAAIANVLRALTPAAPDFRYEHGHFARRDGGREARWLQWTNRGVFDAGGRLAEVQSIGRDITQYQLAVAQARALREDVPRHADAELEARVNARTAELQASLRELESFSYSVSHDLRAPLRAIDGFSQALSEDYAHRLDATGLDYLARVRNGAQRMGELIDDLLGLARVMRKDLRCEPVAIGVLGQEVAQELARAEPGRAVRLAIDAALTATGDPVLLRAALANLLGNAWKFTRTRADALIELGAAGRGGARVFYVRDNGVGFDMAYVAKLFRPFQRLHEPGEFEGTGIGLATVQRIIARHGGWIWAESTAGSGATFFFTIPES